MNIKGLRNKLNKEIFTGKVILIDGPWGSGKTFEVKQFMDNGKGKTYYTSLFGVESLKELTGTLYCLVHPVKSQKNSLDNISVSLLGKGISFSADFGNDKEIEELKKGRGKTIILDDIERVDFSKVKMKNILGYAERLSLQGFAVILVMNSEELDNLSKEALDEFYEKVVDKKYVIDSCNEEVLANQFKGLGVSFEKVKDYFKSNIRMAKKVKKVYTDIKDLADAKDRQNLFEICVKTITGLYGKEAMKEYNDYKENETEDMLKFEFFDPDTLPNKNLAEKLNAVVYGNNIIPSSENLSVIKGIALYDYDGDSTFLEKYYKLKNNALYEDYFVLCDSEKEDLFNRQLKTIQDNNVPEPELALQAIFNMYEEGYGSLAEAYHEELAELFSDAFYSEYIMTSSVINNRMNVSGYGSLIGDVKRKIKDKFNEELKIKLKRADNDYEIAYRLLKEAENKRDIDISVLIDFFRDNNFFLDYIGKHMPCEEYWDFIREEASILKKNGHSNELAAVLDEMKKKDPNNKTLGIRVAALKKYITDRDL